jgi:biopolymer transport protein ExbD
LVVTINRASRAVLLNNESAGSIDDTQPLTDKLAGIFKERENNRVMREGTNQIEKTIFIKSPTSARYGDVVKIIDAAKLAGAEPIGLQIDDLSTD